MLTRDDVQPLSAALGAGALIGLAFGLWLSLPPYLSQPVQAAEPTAVSQIDPNLAQYDQMIAANGISQVPYILPADYSPVSTPPAAQLSSDDAAATETATTAADSGAASVAAAQITPVAWVAGAQAQATADTDSDPNRAPPAQARDAASSAP